MKEPDVQAKVKQMFGDMAMQIAALLATVEAQAEEIKRLTAEKEREGSRTA